MATQLSEITEIAGAQREKKEKEEVDDSCNVKRTLSQDLYVLTFAAWAHKKKIPFAGYWLAFILFIQCFGVVMLIGAYEIEDHWPGLGQYHITYGVLNDAVLTYDISNEIVSIQGATISFGSGQLYLLMNDDASSGKNAARAVQYTFVWIGGICSLMVLFVYISQEIYGQIFLFSAPNFISPESEDFRSIKKEIRIVYTINMILTYLSWVLGVRAIYYYVGDGFPTNAILVPIGILFILEIDEWAAKLFISGYDEINRGDILNVLCVCNTKKQHIVFCHNSWIWFLIICVCPVVIYPIYFLVDFLVFDPSVNFHEQPNTDTFFYGPFAFICYSTLAIGLVIWYKYVSQRKQYCCRRR